MRFRRRVARFTCADRWRVSMNSENRNRSLVAAPALSFLFARPSLKRIPSVKRASRKQIFRTFQFSTFRTTAPLNALLVLTFALSMILIPPPGTEAANPAAGTISPAGPTVTWQGPSTGGACANENTCVEGANCDTFKLTLVSLAQMIMS